jgi:elongation factor G
MALAMPPDVVEIALEPKTSADQDRLYLALTRLAAEDPSFHFTTDHESGQTILKGVGELELESLVARISREFKVEADVGAPQVAYRETLAKSVEVDYTHKEQFGGSGQFGRVKVAVAPANRGSGVLFFDKIKGGNIPREYVPSVEKGMRETAEAGSLMGFPMIDLEIHLIDGAYHNLDSSARAFEIAGRGAMREAAQKAGIKLLEPIMNIEVVTPEDYLGDVIGALNSRRGQIQGTASTGNAQAVTATAPMAQLFGLEKDLKSLTAGGAVVDIVWDRYEFVEPSDTDPDDTFPAAAALRA